MTPHDLELIAQAKQLHSSDWEVAFALEAEAESAEAKSELHTIGTSLYHMDEYNHDML